MSDGVLALTPKQRRIGAALDALARIGESPTGVLSRRRENAATYRLATGIEKLDQLCGGGVLTGKVIGIVGPPSALKTILTENIYARWARAGVLGIGYHADEGDEATAVRHAQHHGFDRLALEDCRPEVYGGDGDGDGALYEGVEGGKGQFFQELTDGIVLANPDASHTTLRAIEEALHDWRRYEPTRPLAITLDSVTSVRLGDEDEDELEPRLHATRVMEWSRRTARELSAIVFVVSQANRSSYRSGARSETIALASGAESRAIEFLSDVLLSLESREDADGNVTATVTAVKNRLGPKGAFRMAFDRKRARLVEIDEAAARVEADEQERRGAEANRAAVLEGIQKHPGSSGRALIKRLRRKGSEVYATLHELKGRGEIVKEGNGWTVASREGKN